MTDVEVGGVRTLFRMPDLLSFGLGGGSLVADDGVRVGPCSVGYRLMDESRVLGGTTLTSGSTGYGGGRAKGTSTLMKVPSTIRRCAVTSVTRSPSTVETTRPSPW